MKLEIINKIIELTEYGKIKSFQSNGKLYDILNIKSFNKTDNIALSNKYIHLLKEFNMDDLKEVFTHNNDFNLVTSTDKYITFKLTHHACEQLLKRMIYIYVESIKFEWSVRMKTIFNDSFDNIIDLLKNNTQDLNTNPFVINLIKSLLNNSEVFTLDKSGRHRDVKSFIRRDKENGKTLRYFNHPFLFIIHEDFLKTVELYSSSEDCRHLNKFTGSTKFCGWLYNKFK